MARGDHAKSNDPRAERAAAECLRDGGGAIDAVLSGFLASAGHDPTVLLSPAVALIGGTGVGVRLLDGRPLQPGRGSARPRGFTADQPIPEAAWIATPRTPALLAALHAYGARKTLAILVREGTAAAKKAGSVERAALIDSIGRHGGGALRRAEWLTPLLRAGGPAAGGVLGEVDLDAGTPDDSAVAYVPVASDLEAALVPQLPAAQLAAAGRYGVRIVVAADARGMVAGLAFAPDRDGVALDELGISAPRAAAPVKRGVRRVAPGTPCSAPAPLAILRRGGWHAVVGVVTERPLEAANLAALAEATTGGLEAVRTLTCARAVLLASSARGKSAALDALAPLDEQAG